MTRAATMVMSHADRACTDPEEYQMVQARTGRRLAAGTAVAIAVAATAAMAPPAPATAAEFPSRIQAVSGHDSSPAKTATATCPEGTAVLGAGGQVVGGGGGVSLAAVVPDPTLTSVIARGLAHPGQSPDWSVVAVAVCGRPPVFHWRAQSPPGSATATCPDGIADPVGTGFALRGSGGETLLTAVIPDPAAGTVSVRATAPGPARPLPPAAYAICAVATVAVPEASSGTDAASPKTVVVPGQRYPMTGAGGLVAGATDVFIDALLPASGLDTVGVRATRVAAGGSARLAGGEENGEDWSVTGYGIETSDYY